MTVAAHAALAMMLGGCVLGWDAPEGTCDLCAPSPIYTTNKSSCDGAAQNYGWLWELGHCYELEACSCVGCEKLPQSKTECEERGREVCGSSLCPGGFN